MGRSVSPVLRRELQNLEKDADSHKSAMRALKSYVKDLDFDTIPVFLAQVSQTKENGSISGESTISLYEVLAQVHGAKIVPMIDSIMESIVQTLSSCAGSFPLQQACSKVVPAIARYGMDPTTPEDKKRHIIHSLCKPLCDSLSSSQECLTSGAALCLKALVDSDNWRFASDEMVNRVCQNVAVALEGKSQTNSHMGLVMALAKRNPLVVEAYARLLTKSGLRILNVGVEVSEGNSQKRFAAIQMVNFLMKCLDPRSIFSEVELIIEEMEICQSDKMAFVKGAAFEALQTARRIVVDKKSRCVKSPAFVTRSNLSMRDYDVEGESLSGDGDHSSTPISPETRTLDFFPGYEYVAESPISTRQPSQNSNYERRSVNRKLWSHENGVVDVSFKDGFFSDAGQGNAWLEHYANYESSKGRGDFTEEFDGFMPRNPTSTTASPLRSCTLVNVDNNKIFTTPRKLIHSVKDPDGATSDCSEKQTRGFRSLLPNSKYDQNDFEGHANYDPEENGNLYDDDEQFEGGPESVSSTNDLPVEVPPEAVPENGNDTEILRTERPLRKTKFKLACGVSIVLLAMAFPLFWIGSQEEGHYLVPT